MWRFVVHREAVLSVHPRAVTTDHRAQARNNAWARRTSDSEAARRAGGRSRYNLMRKARAAARRRAIIVLWGELLEEGAGIFDHGVQAQMAELLGCHRSTICRDLKIIFAEGYHVPCPTCGGERPMSRWRELEGQGKVRLSDLDD